MSDATAPPAASSSTPPPPPPPVGSNPQDERVLAAVAYILLWITGLIVLLTSKPFEKYKRWHAIQAIGLGIVVTALQVVLNILAGAFAYNAMWSVYSSLGGLLGLLTIVLIIVLAVKAHQGEKLRLPVLAEYADKHA